MELEHSFVVPVAPEEAWPVLLDVQRVAPCMPGARLESVDGDEYHGSVTVKVGPIQVTYGGTARFLEQDDAAHRVVIDARGKEKRGAGTATMTVRAHLEPTEGGTRVTALTDLAVTGRPAQFGRGVMADVGTRIIDRFSACLAEQLGAAGGEPVPAPAAAPPAPPITAAEPAPEAEPIDLLGTAGIPVAKRVAPVLVGLLLLWVAWRLVRRRRRR
jgi:carbon monoxide dehydrogenase subunit G